MPQIHFVIDRASASQAPTYAQPVSWFLAPNAVDLEPGRDGRDCKYDLIENSACKTVKH